MRLHSLVPYTDLVTLPRWLPQAEIAFDPFHVIALAGAAVDHVRREHTHAMDAYLKIGEVWIKHARWALLKAPEKLNDHQRLALAGIQQTNAKLYRAYLLKEQLRALYQLHDPARAPAHLKAWLAWASRSQLNRVEARLALAPPTPPGMRVRTGRFAQHSRTRR